MDADSKVLVIHSAVAPYRLPVFESLSKRCNLNVMFCEGVEEGRKWNPDLTQYAFDSAILPNIRIGPIVLNYTAVRDLLFAECDVYVIDGYDPYFVTILTCMLVAKIRRKPFVLWAEHIDTREFGARFSRSSWRKRIRMLLSAGFVNWYQGVVYQNVDRFVAFSKKAERYLTRRGVDKNRISTQIQVVPSSLLESSSGHTKRPQRTTDDKVTILSLGYLRWKKGIDVLIEAYKQVATTNTELIIAGSGPEEKRLKALAGDRNDIRFVGYVEEESKSEYYIDSDIFVLSTRRDPWGLVINEAMYYGLPVITTSAAGSEWIINGNGFVIKPDDSDALADRLERLINNKDMRQKMGRRSRNETEAFEPDTMADTILGAVCAAMGS